MNKLNITPAKVWASGVAAVMSVVLIFLIPMLFENVKSTELVVIQSVWGDLKCNTDPGPTWQGFGTVTTYPRRATYEFDIKREDTNPAKAIRFSDGGTALISGSVSWMMPLDCPSIIKVHRTFAGPAGVDLHGVSKMVDLAIRSSGQMMTAAESASDRLGELTQLISDQSQNGVYQTAASQVTTHDELTNQTKNVTIVQIVKDPKTGQPIRTQGSVLSSYNVTLLPLSITDVDYSEAVENQIVSRQKAAGAQQLAIANASKAVQDAITAEKEGEAAAARAKWKQEEIKAVEVVKAQQAKEVAELDVQTAQAYKQANILRGEGEASRKRLVMEADGNMALRSETLVKVNALWANAFMNYKGAMVPTTVMGGGNASSATNMQSFVDLMTAKAARDVGLDLSKTSK